MVGRIVRSSILVCRLFGIYIVVPYSMHDIEYFIDLVQAYSHPMALRQTIVEQHPHSHDDQGGEQKTKMDDAFHAVGLRSPHPGGGARAGKPLETPWVRSEEHTSELQSLIRISSAVVCL